MGEGGTELNTSKIFLKGRKNLTYASAIMHKKKSQVFLNNSSIVKMIWNLQELVQRTALIGEKREVFRVVEIVGRELQWVGGISKWVTLTERLRRAIVHIAPNWILPPHVLYRACTV